MSNYWLRNAITYKAKMGSAMDSQRPPDRKPPLQKGMLNTEKTDTVFALDFT
jgi:hypothetical protein